jgi:hypothetical protein
MSFSRWQKLIANRTEKVVTCIDRWDVEEIAVKFESARGSPWAENSHLPPRLNRFLEPER